MHTPEALAKHYISYNAKVGEAIFVAFLWKGHVKVILLLHCHEKNIYPISLQGLYLYLYRKTFQNICSV